MYNSKNCLICPRKCGADRTNKNGICGCTDNITIAKYMLHKWEEPCISGTDPQRGSGTVFFSGCPLHCVYCQNCAISNSNIGDIYSINDLSDLFLKLQEMGAYNINLVSPTQFSYHIIKALDMSKPRLNIPVVWNTGGYELESTISDLKGYVDIFLTDFKYGSKETSIKYSKAPNYTDEALKAIEVMMKITGAPKFDSNNMLLSGTIIRHLVLPNERKDSMKALDLLTTINANKSSILSLMSQYTPEFYKGDFSNLKRKLTSFEYSSVLDYALKLGFDGFSQEKSSSTTIYTPDFNSQS